MKALWNALAFITTGIICNFLFGSLIQENILKIFDNLQFLHIKFENFANFENMKNFKKLYWNSRKVMGSLKNLSKKKKKKKNFEKILQNLCKNNKILHKI